MAGVSRSSLGVRHNLRPFGFGDYPYAEVLGLLELRPRARPGDHQVRLGADGTRGAGAEAFGLRFGFVAAHRLEASGENYGLAAPFGRSRVADERLRRDLRQ